ncbi:unnamed protein product [Mytilus edulis]|uniref:Transmembrane protein n=1 Tax=Mytilus edulis TaxID=6550 RepID=A0A8S3QTJ5_MYTED|nr:unnamed protein product [Mytilus edulis]
MKQQIILQSYSDNGMFQFSCNQTTNDSDNGMFSVLVMKQQIILQNYSDNGMFQSSCDETTDHLTELYWPFHVPVFLFIVAMACSSLLVMKQQIILQSYSDNGMFQFSCNQTTNDSDNGMFQCFVMKQQIILQNYSDNGMFQCSCDETTNHRTEL